MGRFWTRRLRGSQACSADKYSMKRDAARDDRCRQGPSRAVKARHEIPRPAHWVIARRLTSWCAWEADRRTDVRAAGGCAACSSGGARACRALAPPALSVGYCLGSSGRQVGPSPVRAAQCGQALCTTGNAYNSMRCRARRRYCPSAMSRRLRRSGRKEYRGRKHPSRRDSSRRCR